MGFDLTIDLKAILIVSIVILGISKLLWYLSKIHNLINIYALVVIVLVL